MVSLSQFYFLFMFYYHILYHFPYLLPLFVVFQSSPRHVFISFYGYLNIFIIALSNSLSCVPLNCLPWRTLQWHCSSGGGILFCLFTFVFLHWNVDLLGDDICCVSWCGHLVPPLLSKCFVLWLLLPLVVNQKNGAWLQSWGYFGF